MLSKMYKNNLSINPTSYLHGPLKDFHFIIIKNVLQP